MTDTYAEWDAAYVLGALDPAERREYAAHLATCEACRTAVAEIAALPGLLASAPLDSLPATAGPATAGPGAPVTGAPGRGVQDAEGAAAPTAGDVLPIALLAVAARRRRSWRRGGLVAAAVGTAVVAGIAGGLADGGWWSDDAPASPGTPSLAAARDLELLPVDGTGLRATLTATPTAWGTRLEWSCRYDGPGDATPHSGAGYGPDGVPAAPEPVTYELVLVGRTGTRVVAATWTAAGREVTGLGASSAVPLASLDRIEITVAGRPEPLAVATL